MDAVVTDPPYGLKFMGKRWDYDVPSIDIWREVLRVLKPGGHLLSFGGTRTYHRMVVNIEDAGFEIRDQLQWIYGSGFPKSHDVSKAIDKQAGAEREVVGENPNNRSAKTKNGAGFDGNKWERGIEGEPAVMLMTIPATPAAKKWDGWGTALKPANEPIVLARKPLSENTVAENVIKWGCGGLNIDASRIEGVKASGSQADFKAMRKDTKGFGYHGDSIKTKLFNDISQGRFPANILFDEVAAEMLDEQSGQLSQCGGPKKTKHDSGMFGIGTPGRIYTEENRGASRFFYCAKSSKSERNAGLEGMPTKIVGSFDGNVDHEHGNRKIGAHPDRPTEKAQNHHPTVKPIKLMQYLIKLITPPHGTVLDPFMGSGSTGVAAKQLGFEFIGIEMNEEYCEIARNRINAT